MAKKNERENDPLTSVRVYRSTADKLNLLRFNMTNADFLEQIIDTISTKIVDGQVVITKKRIKK